MKAERIEKPWGCEELIADEPTYGCKILTVKKGHRLSLQKHKLRDETWYVLKGNAHVNVYAIPLVLRPGNMIQIPRGIWHRLGAVETDVKIIEATNGYVDDDIERKEDDYGRKGKSD